MKPASRTPRRLPGRSDGIICEQMGGFNINDRVSTKRGEAQISRTTPTTINTKINTPTI